MKGANLKVSEYLAEWLGLQELSLQRSTYESMTVYFNRHLIPYFENLNIELAELKALHINSYAKYKLKSGRLDGKQGGLSLVSVRKHISVLKQALNDAVVCDYISVNPAQFVKLPRQNRKLTERTVLLSADEAQKVINAFSGHPLQAAIVITLYYGLRKSELLGLRWSAIDFRKNTLTINHTVVKSSTIECKDSTKTDYSRRTFQLLPDVKQILLHMRENSPVKSDYIFCRVDGSPLRPDSLTRSFQRVLRKNNLPLMRFHDLRHSTASILIDKQWSLESIKKWLGHADIETTSNIYIHHQQLHSVLMANALVGTFTIDNKQKTAH